MPQSPENPSRHPPPPPPSRPRATCPHSHSSSARKQPSTPAPGAAPPPPLHALSCSSSSTHAMQPGSSAGSTSSGCSTAGHSGHRGLCHTFHAAAQALAAHPVQVLAVGRDAPVGQAANNHVRHTHGAAARVRRPAGAPFHGYPKEGFSAGRAARRGTPGLRAAVP
ncbi:hypothetical protein DFP73DRAFT_108331 [Morchella snyderi]|nr:hypothetical protein DFP73DRAFT_108331 [Morchella snyderi]